MKIEKEYETDTETRLYATDPNWICGIEDDERVQLGIYAQIENYREAGWEDMPESHPIGVSFCVVTHKPKLNAAAIQCCTGFTDEHIAEITGDARQELARETLLEYQGGVPADRMLYHGIRRSDESDAFGALVERYEGKAKVIEAPPGRHTLAFAEWEDAEDCARFVIENRADVFCAMIGFFLDAPINPVGQDGWSMIRAAVNGTDWSPVPDSMR